MVIAIMVAIPVAIVVPATLMTVPPPVISAPATFPLGGQVAAALSCLMTALAMLANGLVQLHLSALDVPLAPGMVIRIRLGHSNKHSHTQSGRHRRRYRKSFQAL
jgi:hypothetical protein